MKTLGRIAGGIGIGLASGVACFVPLLFFFQSGLWLQRERSGRPMWCGRWVRTRACCRDVGINCFDQFRSKYLVSYAR